MNLRESSQRKSRAEALPARWLWPLFFAVWTASAVAVVSWIVAGGLDRADVLIALDRSEADSWFARARSWVQTHVELYWAGPWILLAPYVLWFGLRFTLEKRGMLWRVALHLAATAGFISVSQALTAQLESARPKVLVLKKEEAFRSKEGTNAPERVVFTRVLEWHGRNSPATGEMQRAKFVRIQSDFDLFGTNSTFERELTNMTFNFPSGLGRSFGGLPKPPEFFTHRRFNAALDGFAYVALIGVAQAVHFRRRLTERERQAALLEAKLTQSRLHALQAQLQPHFLFNTLNGIATLVRRDPRVAEEMLTSLSDLLRVSFAQSGRQEISLREELEFLDRYLELQQMRFGDRLTVERRIDPAALDCLVPSLLLQPLVENAIRHGIEPSANRGIVCISAERNNGEMVLMVEDNGRGINGEQMPGSGLGLSSVRERLVELYRNSHEFAVEAKPSGGVVARIRIPAAPMKCR